MFAPSLPFPSLHFTSLHFALLRLIVSLGKTRHFRYLEQVHKLLSKLLPTFQLSVLESRACNSLQLISVHKPLSNDVKEAIFLIRDINTVVKLCKQIRLDLSFHHVLIHFTLPHFSSLLSSSLFFTYQFLNYFGVTGTGVKKHVKL